MLQNIGVIQTNNEEMTTLVANPGFTASTMVAQIDCAQDSTALYVEAIGEYKPQNVVFNERVSVKVAEVEATVKVLQFNTIKKTPLLEGQTEVTSTLQLADVLSDPSALTPGFHQTFDSKLQSLIEESQLIRKGDSLSGTYNVKDGKISTEVTHVLYNQEATHLDDNPFRHVHNVFTKQINADKTLTQDVIQTLDDVMLNQYPLIKSEQPCTTLDPLAPNTISDVILSRTYSSNSEQTVSSLQTALKTYAKHSYTNDVVKGLALEIAQGETYPSVPNTNHYVIDGITYFVTRSEPLKIVHCQSDAELSAHSKSASVSIGGAYSAEYNTITFNGESNDKFAPYFIHEASHSLIHHLFKNNARPFTAENANQKEAYTLAELNVFKNVGLKLGLTPDELSDKDEVMDIITLLKEKTILDLIEYEFNPSKVTDVKNKYIPVQESTLSDFNEAEVLDAKLTSSFKALKLDGNDYSVLTEFARLVYDYKEDALTQEVIVRIPQLLAEGVSQSKVESYLKPLMDYWDNMVTPQIDVLFDNHQAACNPDFGIGHFSPTFAGPKYCIEEFVTLEV